MSMAIRWRRFWVALFVFTLVACGVDPATKSDVAALHARLDSTETAQDALLTAILDSLQAVQPVDLHGPLAGHTLWVHEPVQIDIDPGPGYNVAKLSTILSWRFTDAPDSGYTWTEYVFLSPDDTLMAQADRVAPGIFIGWQSKGTYQLSRCDIGVCDYVTARLSSRAYSIGEQGYLTGEGHEAVVLRVVLSGGHALIGNRNYSIVETYKFARILLDLHEQRVGG